MSSPRAYCLSNPTLPFTRGESPRQASDSSTDQGGGKRRATDAQVLEDAERLISAWKDDMREEYRRRVLGE